MFGIASINQQVVNVATLGAPVESMLTSVMVGEKSFVDLLIRYARQPIIVKTMEMMMYKRFLTAECRKIQL